MILARDTIFAATLLSVPVILAMTWLAGFLILALLLTVGQPRLRGAGAQARNQAGWP